MYEEIKYNKEFAKTFNEETRKSNREKHIVNNIPFARFVASNMYLRPNGFFDADDLCQIANTGLINAVDRFDFSKNVKFSSYAYQYCSGYILSFLMEVGNPMRVPRKLYLVGNKINTLSSQGYSDEEIINMVGEEDFLRASSMRRNLNLASLDFMIQGKDGSTSSIGETIQDNNIINEEGICNYLDLHKAITKLKKKERDVIELYYFKDMNEANIAIVLGISRSYVNRIRRAALKKLKEELTHDE